MAFHEYDNATLRQIDNCFRGWQKAQEQSERSQWVRTRWQTLWLLGPQVKKGGLKSIENAMRFDWENDKAPEFQGDVSAVLAKWDEIEKQKRK